MVPRLLLLTGVALASLAGQASAQRLALHRPAAAWEAQECKQRVFPVADLVVPIPTQPPGSFRALPEEVKVSEVDEGRKGPRNGPLLDDQRIHHAGNAASLDDQLMHLVTNTVSPKSWREKGGPATLQYYPLGMSLVVSAPPAVLEEVSDLLSALRRLQDLEVKVELRVVHVAPAHLEKAARELRLNRTQDKALLTPAESSSRLATAKGGGWLAQMDKQKTEAFFNLIAEHESASVTQAPAATLFNGQNVHLNITEQQGFVTGLEVVEQGVFVPKNKVFAVGSRFGIKPVVSADRRSVRVELEASLASILGEPALTPVKVPVKTSSDNKEETIQMFLQTPTFTKVHAKSTFSTADGGSTLLHCGVVPVEVEKEVTPEFLQRVPYLHRLFRHVVRERAERSVLIVVTPHVIVNEEREVVFLGEMTPIPREK